jgi:hypothetical protein
MLGGPISWCSRKQSIVALSTTEAEYFAAAECCKELKYLKMLIEEFTGKRVEADLYVDNQSAIKLIESGQVTHRSKHVDVRYHYICEKLKEKLFSINYCNTNVQIADIVTKPLLTETFVKFRDLVLRRN